MNKIPHKILIGVDNFKKMIVNGTVFVDKSLFIKQFIEDGSEVILITRPRRWGKTLNMDMLKTFLEMEGREKSNQKLFLGGEIESKITGKKQLHPLRIAEYSEVMKWQGQFPVIYMSFKDIIGKNYEEVEAAITRQLLSVFREYEYLNTSEKLSSEEKIEFKHYSYPQTRIKTDEIATGLALLSQLLYKHFDQKVVVLIDEYDTPMNNLLDEEEWKRVANLLRAMLGSALKGNKYLEKGLITGILRIAKANMFSGLNNLMEYTLLDEEFSEHYGFLQEEIDSLLKQTETDQNNQLGLEIRDWYNGYLFSNRQLYNPWSIMCCLARKGKIGNYWQQSGSLDNLTSKMLLSDAIQDDLQNLLLGKSIERSVKTQIAFDDLQHSDTLLSLLLFTGYLTAKEVDGHRGKYHLSIPNREVHEVYRDLVMKSIQAKLNINMMQHENLIQSLLRGEVKEFGETLKRVVMHSSSYYDLVTEKDFHNLMSGMLSVLNGPYVIESNRETGYGRCDHIIVPKGRKQGDSAIILEYKHCQQPKQLSSMAKKALEQIEQKQYSSTLENYSYVQNVIEVGIAFCGKQLCLFSQTNRLS